MNRSCPQSDPSATTVESSFAASRPWRSSNAESSAARLEVQLLRECLNTLTKELGRRPRVLVAGLGRHLELGGAEQLALTARDVGFEVIYDGLRGPNEVAVSVLEESVHAVLLSAVDDDQLALLLEIIDGLRSAGVAERAILVFGSLGEGARQRLGEGGITRVFTPARDTLHAVMRDLAQGLNTETRPLLPVD